MKSRLLRLIPATGLLIILMTASIVGCDRQGATDTIIQIPNGDFEKGREDWTFYEGRGDCGITTRHVAGGKRALRIVGDRARKGAKVTGPMVACKGPGVIELRGKSLGFSGRHLGLYIHEFSADGKMLPNPSWGELGGTGGKWGALLRQVNLNEKTTHIRIFLLGYPGEGELIEVYLDDLHFVRPAMRIPPWESQYKLRPEDKDKLTPADVVGPDGVVYPNWKQVGVQGGIPKVPVALKLADVDARPGTDISALLDKACKDLGAKKGGAILIDEGTFYLDTPVNIRQSGIVIRGSGRDKTKIIFRGGVGVAGTDVGFYWPPENGIVGPDTQVAVHAYHMKLKRLTIYRDNKKVKTQIGDGAWTYALGITGKELIDAGGAGAAVLKAEAEYDDGRKVMVERKVTLSTTPQEVKSGPSFKGALFFWGAGLEGEEYLLAKDGKRGDTILTFKNIGDLKVGQKLDLHAPMTERFSNIIKDRGDRGAWKRVGYYEIKTINGKRLTINQPLRIDFPVVDGSYARRLNPIEKCGVEDLTIEHINRLPIDSVTFNWGWNCWVRNVKVIKTGRNGAYAWHSKWIEIRNCELDRAWNNDGGQAYAGFTRSADCLFVDCVVKKYRHGPVVQYGAMGCVFRNSTFDGSDLQWHAGWSTENLFENCIVRSYHGSGSYGYGAYATGSDDLGHGPNGPRNVVYNCDLTSEKSGVMLNGVNENWLFLHNRFVVKKGAGFVATSGSFDHIIRNNTFILRDGKSPMLQSRTPDCVGVDLVGNRLYGGNGKVYQGAPKLDRDEKNQSHPAAGDKLPPRPKADPPSIYEWQKAQP